MRASREEKEKSRERIIDAASRLLRKNGMNGASVDDIMKEAGMTHGGFYRHFPDKESLLAAAVADAFDHLAVLFDTMPAGRESNAADTFRSHYVSKEHRANPATGCPAAALGPDIARASEKVRAEFSQGLEKILTRLEARNKKNGASRHEAIRAFSMMLGAIILSRAADDALGGEILLACSKPPA
jgi:TetR/AcrR family transcriptional regulator, transcriptional repressor for nem operon